MHLYSYSIVGCNLYSPYVDLNSNLYILYSVDCTYLLQFTNASARLSTFRNSTCNLTQWWISRFTDWELLYGEVQTAPPGLGVDGTYFPSVVRDASFIKGVKCSGCFRALVAVWLTEPVAIFAPVAGTPAVLCVSWYYMSSL